MHARPEIINIRIYSSFSVVPAKVVLCFCYKILVIFNSDISNHRIYSSSFTVPSKHGLGFFFFGRIYWNLLIFSSRLFAPARPQQRITSGLNTNFTLSPSSSFHKSSYHESRFFRPIYIPRALDTGTCIRQGDLFYPAGLHRNHVLATANTGKIGRGFGKNACERIGRVEMSKGEIPGRKRSMYGYILTYSRL